MVTMVASTFTSELKMCLNGFKGADFKMSRLHRAVSNLFDKQCVSGGDEGTEE